MILYSLTSISIPNICEQRPKSGLEVNLHHDNANAHTLSQTRDFITDKSIQLLGQPPYFSHFVPCNYIFRMSKILCMGHVLAYKERLNTFTKSQWRN